MDEFQFIDAIKQKTYKQSSLIHGIGDDAAVIRMSGDMVAAVDTMVDHVHFSKETMSGEDVGYRALAANISDLAAMGAAPRFYLVSIVIPKTSDWSEDDLQEIFLGMKELGDEYRMDLIGGDTVSGSELSVSVTIIGELTKGKARLRSTAQKGDIVFVTGTLGDARAGLHLLETQEEAEQGSYFMKRHRRPSPRVDFAMELQLLDRVTLDDVSDGIASEANEIAGASRVTIVIDDKEIPVHENLAQFSETLQSKWKLQGGEDFELLGTVPEKDWHVVLEAAEKTNTPVRQIGTVTEEDTEGLVYLTKNGKRTRLEKSGYTHLNGRR